MLSQKPTAPTVAALTGNEEFFVSDDYLIPVVEDDPLLRKTSSLPHHISKLTLDCNSELQSDDWSDEEEDEPSNGTNATEAPKDLNQALHRIRQLEEKLRKARQDITDYRGFVKERLDLAGLAESLRESVAVSSTNAAIPLRDDDSHYFQSYAENGECAHAGSSLCFI